MAYSVQKSRLAKVAGVSLVLLLAACSSDSRYKRQVSGDEAYLQASPLSELHAPAGMILPIQVGDYNIPVANSTGAVGKALDIRPPAQPLHPEPPARAFRADELAATGAGAAGFAGLAPGRDRPRRKDARHVALTRGSAPRGARLAAGRLRMR